jgi:tetratricopeptide (TPR) repeat protein
MAIEALCDPPELRKFARFAINSRRFPSLILEIVFQTFYECFNEQLFHFFEVLSNLNPNLAHRVLARFSDNFHVPIVTTNFDTLIEQVKVTSKPVVHVHGILTDRKQMIVRIYQVGRGLSKNVGQEAGRFIRGKTLCVLGYSGSDEDIRALFKQYKPKMIFWFVRSRKDFAIKNIQRSFAEFKNIVSIGDLNRLVRLWATAFNCGNYTAKLKSNAHHKHYSALWRGHLTVADRYAALSRLMIDLEEYHSAAETAQLGYRKCRNSDRASWFLTQASVAQKLLAKTHGAIANAKAASRIARRKNSLFDLAAALRAEGDAHLEGYKSDPRRALSLFRRSEKIIPIALKRSQSQEMSERTRSFASRLYNGIGLASLELSKYGDARRAFMKSLKYKRRAGDLIGSAITSANLARLFYRQKKYATAHKWKCHSMYLFERYDRTFQKAYLLRSFGAIACDQGRVRQGLKLLNETLKIYKALKSELGIKLTAELIRKFDK